jgi:uncharacterized protein YecT (DUF1311 family)
MKAEKTGNILLSCVCLPCILLAPQPNFAHAQVQTQYDMNMQAEAKYDAADIQLNIIYEKLIRSLHPTAAKKLRKSEHAWIRHRDSEATAECAESVGGSIYPMEYDEALYDLTEQRIKLLKAQIVR